jgi:hypothetical protein
MERLYGKAQAHRLEDRHQAAEFGITFGGKGAVELGRVQMRLLGNPGNATTHLGRQQSELVKKSPFARSHYLQIAELIE